MKRELSVCAFVCASGEYSSNANSPNLPAANRSHLADPATQSTAERLKVADNPARSNDASPNAAGGAENHAQMAGAVIGGGLPRDMAGEKTASVALTPSAAHNRADTHADTDNTALAKLVTLWPWLSPDTRRRILTLADEATDDRAGNA